MAFNFLIPMLFYKFMRFLGILIKIVFKLLILYALKDLNMLNFMKLLISKFNV